MAAALQSSPTEKGTHHLINCPRCLRVHFVEKQHGARLLDQHGKDTVPGNATRVVPMKHPLPLKAPPGDRQWFQQLPQCLCGHQLGTEK